MDVSCDVSGEEAAAAAAAAAEEEDEEQLQLPAPDGLSSSPGKTGLCGADTDGLSPGEDADSKGEREIRER